MARSINVTKRNVPVDQIIAIKGRNPIATGIESAGNVLGQVLLKKAELRRQGQELARLESLYGLNQGELAGLPTDTAASLGKYVSESRKPTYIQQIGPTGEPNLIEVPAGGKFGGMVKTPAPTSQPKLQYQGRDESGNPISFDPTTNTLNVGSSKFSGNIRPKQEKVLPGGVLQDIKNQESAISLLEEAARTAPEIIKRSTGMIGGRVLPAIAKVPGVGALARDPQRAVFQQNVKTGLLKFLYSEAGKQLSDPERLAVTDAIGSIDRADVEFVPLLNNAISIIKGAQQRYQQSLGGSGYIVPPSGLSPIEPPAPKSITPRQVGKYKVIKVEDE